MPFGRPNFIRAHADDPFFLYLPFNACHGPVEAPGKYIDRFTEIRRSAAAGVCRRLDRRWTKRSARFSRPSANEISKKNTLIFFLSDNGSAGSAGSDNKPWKRQKMYHVGRRNPRPLLRPVERNDSGRHTL